MSRCEKRRNQKYHHITIIIIRIIEMHEEKATLLFLKSVYTMKLLKSGFTSNETGSSPLYYPIRYSSDSSRNLCSISRRGLAQRRFCHAASTLVSVDYSKTFALMHFLLFPSSVISEDTQLGVFGIFEKVFRSGATIRSFKKCL